MGGRGQGSDWITVPSDCAPTNQEPKNPGFPSPFSRGREPHAWFSTLYLHPEPLGIRPCLKPCIAPLSPCVCGFGYRGEVSEGLDVLGLHSQCSPQRKALTLSLCSSVCVLHPTPTWQLSVLPCCAPQVAWFLLGSCLYSRPALALCPCL